LGYVLQGKMLKNDKDEALAAKAASGEAAAFRELLTRHYDRVFRVVYGVLRDMSEAEDVTQEIWAAMPKKLRQWRGQAKLTELESLSRAEAADAQLQLSWLQTAPGYKQLLARSQMICAKQRF